MAATPIYGKSLGAESLLKSSGEGEGGWGGGGWGVSTKVAKIMVLQVCFPMHLYGEKTFKNLILQNRGCLMAESLYIYHWEWVVYQSC